MSINQLETSSIQTELAELLVKILHRLDRQDHQASQLAAENAELRKRVDELERVPRGLHNVPYTTNDQPPAKSFNQLMSGELKVPAHSSSARKS